MSRRPKNPGNAKTHHKRRQRLRQRLRAEGVSEAEIATILERKRREQLATRETDPLKRHRLIHAEEIARAEAYTSPDDRGFRPTRIDPLLRGTARAVGATARAVRRGTTYTDDEVR